MKLLVATKETQGQRKSDFSHAEEGDPVYMGGGACDRDRNDIDGGCGCMRAMIGLKSHGATTTMKVIQRDMTMAELRALVREGYDDYIKNKIMTEEDVTLETKDLLIYASTFDVGMIIEKRGNKLANRKTNKVNPKAKGELPRE
jgi:hypothetical protein